MSGDWYILAYPVTILKAIRGVLFIRASLDWNVLYVVEVNQLFQLGMLYPNQLRSNSFLRGMSNQSGPRSFSLSLIHLDRWSIPGVVRQASPLDDPLLTHEPASSCLVSLIAGVVWLTSDSWRLAERQQQTSTLLFTVVIKLPFDLLARIPTVEKLSFFL